MPIRELTERDRVEILLVFGAEIKTSRNGSPGIRVTAGYHDGTVLLEAVGFDTDGEAQQAITEATWACWAAGMGTRTAPRCMSTHRARLVWRNP